MWCQNCGQDVPGIAAEGSSEYRCPRCRGALRQGDISLRIGGGSEHTSEQDKDSASLPRASSYDGWALEQRLKHIERLLAAEIRSLPAGIDDEPGEQSATPLRPATQLRFDAAHAEFTQPHDQNAAETPSIRGRLASAFVWSALLIGAAMSACGGFLMGWSMLAAREDVWSIGLPISLVGGIGLFAALIGQLDRLMNEHRDTTARLDVVDNQLHRLAAAAKKLDLMPAKIGRQQ